MSHSELPASVPAGTLHQQALAPDGLTVAVRACWNEIGVYGSSVCPELKHHIHCRNCPVYSRAGIQLLDRALPADYRRDWSEHFAVEKRRREHGNTSAVFFRIQSEWLAIPTLAFQEVSERRPIHSLPHQRQQVVLGLANVRGELLIAVSLGHLLNLEGVPPGETLRATHHRLLVTNWEGHRFAMPVDEVLGPHTFHPQDLKAPPATVSRSSATFTHAVLHWQGRAVGCLRPDSLFSALNRSLA